MLALPCRNDDGIGKKGNRTGQKRGGRGGGKSNNIYGNHSFDNILSNNTKLALSKSKKCGIWYGLQNYSCADAHCAPASTAVVAVVFLHVRMTDVAAFKRRYLSEYQTSLVISPSFETLLVAIPMCFLLNASPTP